MRPHSTGLRHRTAALGLTALLFAACAPGETIGTGAGGSSGAAGSSAAGSSGGTGNSGGAAGAGGAGGNGGTTGVAGAAGTTGVAGTTGETGAAGMGGAGAGGTGVGGTAGAGSAGRGGTTGAAGRGGTTGAAGGGGTTGAAGRGGTTGSAGRGGTGGSATAGTTGTGGSPPAPAKFVGNIDTRGQIRSDFVRFWNQFSPENAGKWGSVEGTRDRMNWAALDTMYNYAKQQNIPFKQHTFVWGSQQPGWVAGLSQAEQREEVEEWIRLYCERYPDTAMIDVVNEPPPHTTPSYIAALGGAGASGYDWIAQAFRWAHQYCPNAILILNDYNNIEYAADNARTIDIANRVKNAGAPIHALGAQTHDAYRLSTSTVQMYIDRLASQTGLPVYITEYDIDLADDNQQRNVMESQITMFWNNRNVRGITVWGYVVGSTWRANTGLMSSSGTMRPAMTWLMGFLGR
jgi:endo-1,4-beta-xylanase